MNVLNLYEKHLMILAFHMQQFTIGILNLIGEEITSKMNLVLLDQEVHSLQKTLQSRPSADQCGSAYDIPTDTRHLADWIGSN